MRSPQLGVDLQGLGQHFGTHVAHGVAADVQSGQRGVASQGVEDHNQVPLQPGVGQRQRAQRLGDAKQRKPQSAVGVGTQVPLTHRLLLLDQTDQVAQDRRHVPATRRQECQATRLDANPMLPAAVQGLTWT